MNEISAPAAAKLLAELPEQTILLDVREAEELAATAVSKALHLPMGEIPARPDHARNRHADCLTRTIDTIGLL